MGRSTSPRSGSTSSDTPSLVGLDAHEVLQIVLVNEFLFFFLLMPSVIPMTLASFSIIGEKLAHSLEPLLATPVSTSELLFGKAVAAVIPAVLVTWLAYALFVVGASLITTARVVAVILNPAWLMAMIVIGPLIGVLSVFIGVIISSRVNDTRIAQQVGGLIALPDRRLRHRSGGRFPARLSRVVRPRRGGASRARRRCVLAGVRLFQRDRILTEWK